MLMLRPLRTILVLVLVLLPDNVSDFETLEVGY
jgi:hypothetical protein